MASVDGKCQFVVDTCRVLKTVLGTKYLSVNIIVIDVDVDLFSCDTVRLLFNKMIELRSGEVECVSTVGLTR